MLVVTSIEIVFLGGDSDYLAAQVLCFSFIYMLVTFYVFCKINVNGLTFRT